MNVRTPLALILWAIFAMFFIVPLGFGALFGGLYVVQFFFEPEPKQEGPLIPGVKLRR